MAGFLGLRKMLLGEKDKEKEIQIIWMKFKITKTNVDMFKLPQKIIERVLKQNENSQEN
jgi:hypothetical protein